MESWHVLYTKPNAERKVLASLEARGINAYLPTIPVARARPDRPTERPFFSCYLFAELDLETHGIASILYTPGLRRIVEFDGVPARVDPRVIARLRERLAAPPIFDTCGAPIRRGDVVEIRADGFEGMDAVFDRQLTPEGRVRVLLCYLQYNGLKTTPIGRQVSVDLHMSQIRKKPLAVSFGL